MPTYKVLNKQSFATGDYIIVPIRMKDRYLIMKWRNEQIYHLRQNTFLTKREQDYYFEQVVTNIFEQDKPDQLLFSFLKKDQCIGYGGLVHINWTDQNAEISFIMDTSLEKHSFKLHWTNFLKLIEQVAFEELSLHKIFTFAFDLRPKIYEVLENNAYTREAILKGHHYYDGKFINVTIHSKFR